MRIVFFLLAAAASMVWLSAQDAPFIVKVDVPLVLVDVVVSDESGKLINDLDQKDFVVLEDGVAQEIRYFAPVESPYSVVLLLDCSESTRDRFALLLGSMARFMSQLRPKDRVAIAAFGMEVQTLVEWDGAKRPLDVASSKVCVGTDFYGAVDWVLEKLKRVGGRRGAVVFTDGMQSDVARRQVTVDGDRVRRVVDPSDDRDFQKILRKAREIAAPLYFVAADTDLNPGPRYAGPVPDLQQIRARMELLAKTSGGRIVFPNQPQDVAPMFLAIGRDLGMAYSLGYAPSKTDGPDRSRKIDVRVPGRDLQVRQSRDSYSTR